jgi:hypothetical protein
MYALDDVYMKRAVRAGDVNYAVPRLIYAALIAAALLLIAYPPLVGFTANARNVALLAGFGLQVRAGAVRADHRPGVGVKATELI